MVTILVACILALALIAAMIFAALVCKSRECERLLRELYNMRAIKPIIDDDGGWTDWDGKRT